MSTADRQKMDAGQKVSYQGRAAVVVCADALSVGIRFEDVPRWIRTEIKGYGIVDRPNPEAHKIVAPSTVTVL